MRYRSGSEYSLSPESGNQEFFVSSAESSVSGNSWSAQALGIKEARKVD